MHKIEWMSIEEGTAIRQGDLLIKKNLRDKSVEDRLITITADCDFAQTKTGGALAALRVLPLDEYVRTYWTKKQAEKLANDHRELISTFNKLIKDGTGREPLSSTAIDSWISRTPAEEIVKQIGIIDAKLKAKLILASKKLKALEAVFLTAGEYECLEKIIEYCVLKDACDNSTARQGIMKKVRSDLNSMPEDTFILNTLGEDFQIPHVVLLRNLVFVGLDEATVSAEVARTQGCYLRYARLSPTFKYAISQQFGLLYSRIGLPPEYDQNKKNLTSTFAC